MRTRHFLSAFLLFGFCLGDNVVGAAVNTSRTLPTTNSDVSRTVDTNSNAIRSVSNNSSNKIQANSISRSVDVNNSVVSRAVSDSRATVSRSAITNSTDYVTARSGANQKVTDTSINNSAAAKRAGVTLRASMAEFGGRGTIGVTGVQTGSNVDYGQNRNVTARSAVDMAAVENISAVSDLNKSCQTQYNECMDQFCSVVDANQKRCSCSANLENYSQVEDAVKAANEELNEVAQRIRYVGLTGDEIRAIMTDTEAEKVLATTQDSTESRNLLDDIEKLIENPNVSFNTSNNSFGLDFDLSFSSDTTDLFNLDFLNNSSNNFSNLRGSALRDAAKKSCASILTQCTNAGADEKQIVGNYDLAIDRDCLAYEDGLIKMNDTLKSNVRAATQMLQQARLAVLQNENIYDTKGCIGALETCMTDDMVCGDDYEKCLDPTKKYIDENGDVVLGENISKITEFMSDYNNASITESFLENHAGTIECGDNGDCIVGYLLKKIGTGQTVKDGGLCRGVLDKCKQATYTDDDDYKPYNEVVLNYIQRAMVNIKADQQQIISDYASTCLLDVASCYNQQVSQVNSWTSNASIGSIYNVMRGACRNVALTCSYAIFWADTESCPTEINTEEGFTLSANQEICINSISEIFYQSLLCPNGSVYTPVSWTNSDLEDEEADKYVNQHCKCGFGYQRWNNSCVLCADGYSPNQITGICEDSEGNTEEENEGDLANPDDDGDDNNDGNGNDSSEGELANPDDPFNPNGNDGNLGIT